MNKKLSYHDAEDRRAIEWVDSQKKVVTFSVPSRMPNEPQANDAQLAELRKLGMTAADELAELSTLQAAAAIERLRQEKKQFTDDCIKQWTLMEWRKYATEIAWLIILVVIVIMFFRDF